MGLQSRLPKIAAVLAAKADLVTEKVADRVVEEAKTRVPVDTGHLRDAIHIEPAEGHLGHWVIAGGQVEGDADVWYGHIVEHGGAHTPPKPFLVPATETVRGEINAIGDKLLKDL